MSTKEKEYKSIESIRLEAELLLADYLFENEFITESAYKLQYVGSSSQTLLENTSRQNSPGYHYNKIHYIDFKNVWNNIRDYPTIEDVYRVFHPGVGQIASNTASNWAGRALKKFLGEGNDPGVPEARKELVAKTTRERSEVEKKIRAGEVEEYEDEFGSMSIDGGYQRKASRSGNIERASTLFPGDLYSDVSKIPKRRWGSWWKRFLRRQTSVADPESSILSMRKWTKHFIMGYQISPTLFFEIWYNSMNSTFSVHDKNGNVVRQGADIPLMRDALNVLFHNVADTSPQDAAVLNMRSPDLRKVNQDIARALNGEIDVAQSYAERMRERKDKIVELRKQQEERDREKAEQRDRAAANARGGFEREAEEDTDQSIKDKLKDAAKAKMKDAVKKGFENYKKSADNFSKGDDDKVDTVYANAEKRRRAKQRAAAAAQFDAESEPSNQSTPEYTSREKQEEEDKRLAAEKDLKSQIAQAEKELADIEYDSASAPSEIERAALQRELEVELHDMKAAAEKLEDGEFNSRLERELRSIERRAATRDAKKERRKNKKEKDDMEEYARKRNKGKNNSVSEAVDPFSELSNDEDGSIDIDDYAENPLYHVLANQEVEAVRKKAETSPFTRQLMNTMFLEGFIQMYEKTRVRDNRTFIRRIFDRLRLFRGRVEPIALPTRVVSSYMRAKGFFGGAQARADFIIGYTINDVADFEIWYVQEISKDGKAQIASFYLYDITAMKVIERDIPHYRNAVQMLLLKIGSEDTKG